MKKKFYWITNGVINIERNRMFKGNNSCKETFTGTKCFIGCLFWNVELLTWGCVRSRFIHVISDAGSYMFVFGSFLYKRIAVLVFRINPKDSDSSCRYHLCKKEGFINAIDMKRATEGRNSKHRDKENNTNKQIETFAKIQARIIWECSWNDR